MAATYSTDLSAWIPAVIGASAYDTMAESLLALSDFASFVPGLEGQAGDRVSIPTVGVTTPADNLAETVPAVDDKLTGAGVTVLIKEAVKSIAWSDRSQIQTNQDVNQLAGQRLGGAMADRVELDLAAATLAGRDTTKDAYVPGALTLVALRALRARIPAFLRRRGVTVFIPSAKATSLLDDATVNNAAAWGGSEVMETGEISRPLYGMRLVEVDDSVFANITVGANPAAPPVVAIASGMLVRAVQKDMVPETERDARARLTRIVGTALHGEGVVDARGVVATAVTG